MQDREHLAGELAHVLWIGGSPCAGKTSIADSLAEKYQGAVYHFDRMEPQHIARTTAANNPDLMAFLAMDMDQRWLTRSPDEMAHNAMASWLSRFPMVLDDLRAMPTTSPIFAEGPGLFPECVAPLPVSPDQAIWLVAAEPFCLMVRQQRGGSSLNASDPDLALRNIVQRDVVMARAVERQASERHLACHTVDGSRSLAQMIALVEQHFAPYLRARHAV